MPLRWHWSTRKYIIQKCGTKKCFPASLQSTTGFICITKILPDIMESSMQTSETRRGISNSKCSTSRKQNGSGIKKCRKRRRLSHVVLKILSGTADLCLPCVQRPTVTILHWRRNMWTSAMSCSMVIRQTAMPRQSWISVRHWLLKTLN